jgi:hypothetical protein
MIFLDTSAIYAWTDTSDSNHATAVAGLEEILTAGEQLLTHNYVLLEAFTLLQARLGLSVAGKFARDCAAFEIVWVDAVLHDAAIRESKKLGKRAVSLVDNISFLVMKRRNVATAFAFDAHFKSAGFRIWR